MNSYNTIPDIPISLYTSHLNIVPYDGGAPWHSNAQQEYFEIEIHSDGNYDADLLLEKDIDILNVNKYTCHICNIQVPNMYVKEHNSSIKHKTCMDIANIALERTKLQMQLDVAATRKVEVVDTYFCEPCSTTVFSCDSEAHIKSKGHKVSEKHDELLTELLKIYTDINNVEIESEIDELELLKQRIEAESRLEETGAKECPPMSEPVVDTSIIREELLNAFRVDIQTVLEEKFQNSVEINDKVKILEDSMNICQRRLEKFNHDSKETWNNIDALNKNMDGLSQSMLIPVKKRLKNKAFRKYQIKKKKEHFNVIHKLVKDNAVQDTKIVQTQHKKTVTFDKTIDSNDDTFVPISCTDELYRNKNAQIKNEKHIERTDKFIFKKVPSIDITRNKIDEIMAKYFDTNRTVDALSTKTYKIHKNKVKKNRNTTGDQVDQMKQAHGDGQSIKHNNQEREVNNDNLQDHSIDKNKEGCKLNIEKVQKEDKFEDTDNKNTITDPTQNEEHNNNDSTQNKNTGVHLKQQSVNEQRKIQECAIKKYKGNNTQVNVTKENKNKKSIEPKSIAKPQVKIEIPSFNLICYLKDITRKCLTEPIHSVKAITDNIVQITSINGDKFKVLVNNFHSFHVKGQDTCCKVCEATSIRRPEWHIIENEHRAKVMIPIHDHNGIRQLDDIWSHCILCNDLTKNIDFHLQSLLHKNKVKHCLVELGKDTDHSDDTSRESKQFKSKKDEKIQDLITSNNLAMTSKNYLNCNICDVIVNNDLLTIQQHITSFGHLNSLEQVWNANKLVDLNEDRFYCIPCDVNISKVEIISHCKGAKHKKLLPVTLNKLNETPDCDVLPNEENGNEIYLTSISQNVKYDKSELDGSELICFVCNVILYCVEEHMDSFEHKKSYYSYLEANKLNEIEDDTFFCIPCNTVITIDYLMSHATSRKHKVRLHNFLGNKMNVQTVEAESDEIGRKPSFTASTSQMPQSSTPSNVNNKHIPLKILYQFKEMMESTKLLCTVCDEEIYYSKKLVEYHVKTLDHIVAFNLLMLWNKIKKRDDRYYCDICHLDLTYFSEITHVLGKQHSINLAKEPKGTVYEYDRTLVTHAYAMSHKVGDRTRLTSILKK